MTKAVRRVLEFCFRSLSLNRVYADCAVENAGSARVLEKAGLSFEGLAREHMRLQGMSRYMRQHGILRDEFAE